MQPQTSFAEWAKTYNSRNRSSRSAFLVKDQFIWKLLVLIGLTYVVWSDKISFTLFINEQTRQELVSTAQHLSELVPAQAAATAMAIVSDESNWERPVEKPKPKAVKARQATAAPMDEAKIIRYRKYVYRFAPVATAEMRKYGIPASITLAQGLLESDAGGSTLARSANNHFGMKCFSKKCARGHCINHGDDTHKDFFVKYPNAWRSYRDHSERLKNNPRYSGLFASTNYRNWAKGLVSAGYATDKKYAEKLIRIIETLGLQKYDQMEGA